MSDIYICSKVVFVMFEGVFKVFGKDVVVVDNIDFSIEVGKLVMFLGLFGCGKMIILCMIVGLEMVSLGCILIGDINVMKLFVMDWDVLMVF